MKLCNLLSEEEFYGIYYPEIVKTQKMALQKLEDLFIHNKNSIQHISTRIKRPMSMCAKLEKHLLPCNAITAVTEITDAIGIRIICNFLDEVFSIVNTINTCKEFTVICEKDYIHTPKPNGYRSYHMIVEFSNGTYTFPIEIQIRTISQDAWASLEHQIKYKRDIPQQALIQDELKRCADELASTDISMQTIRELIENKEL